MPIVCFSCTDVRGAGIGSQRLVFSRDCDVPPRDSGRRVGQGSSRHQTPRTGRRGNHGWQDSESPPPHEIATHRGPPRARPCPTLAPGSAAGPQHSTRIAHSIAHKRKAGQRKCPLTCAFTGGGEGSRTPDTGIFSPLLYQLSYPAKGLLLQARLLYQTPRKGQ